jgi:hypothetical protein
MARPLLFNNLQAVSANFCRNRARSSLSLIAKTTIHGAFRKYTYETEIPDIWGAARQRSTKHASQITNSAHGFSVAMVYSILYITK